MYHVESILLAEDLKLAIFHLCSEGPLQELQQGPPDVLHVNEPGGNSPCSLREGSAAADGGGEVGQTSCDLKEL